MELLLYRTQLKFRTPVSQSITNFAGVVKAAICTEIVLCCISAFLESLSEGKSLPSDHGRSVHVGRRLSNCQRFPPAEIVSLSHCFICLDKHIPCKVYKRSGVCLRNHCRAEPPRDT